MPTTKAVVVTAPHRAQIQAVDLPDPGPGELRVEIRASAVSVGTEMRVFRGIQEPHQQFPVIPGYANSGVVVEAGEGTTLAVGTRVHAGGTRHASIRPMWGGHCGHVIVPEDDVVVLPVEMDFKTACLLKLGAIAQRGFLMSEAKAGQTALIIGLGIIGQSSLRVFTANGIKAVGVDVRSGRVDAAKADGLKAIETGNLLEAKSVFPDGPDFIVDCTGSEGTLIQALELCREIPWGDVDHHPTKYVIQGSYPGRVSLPYQEAFVKELTYLIPRDCQLRDKKSFLKYWQEGKVKLDSLTSSHSYEQAPSVYEKLDKMDSHLICPILEWG